ncbi:hydroxymethylbilane synthase [Bradyrhizobium sp. UNPA324]|uniref:hydroxymethylbilane synthase n=1 Tax=Bradyrhizobium sp. UNPA324 TaxID=1141174 RepID=UPI00114D9625|nr:hydroxymethylbilane synthase [Bradyrhizobium sp. UNPA324]
MEIRLGTRRSDLARWQASHVAALIHGVEPTAEVRLVFTSSVGDRDRRSSFQQFGGIGAFTKESEDALMQKEVDLVVHSLKDLPTRLQPGLVLAAVPKRADPRDTICGVTLDQLRPRLRVGTGSIRRKAQLLALCSGLDVRPIRGNVFPRLCKAKNREGIDATLLAAAGLSRLGLLHEASQILDSNVFPYAVGQGALAVEAREEDTALIALLQKIEDRKSRTEVDAERALMRSLDAGCSLPLGVSVEWVAGTLTLRGQVTHPDGHTKITDECAGTADQADAIGTRLGDKLLQRGAEEILKAVPRIMEEQRTI